MPISIGKYRHEFIGIAISNPTHCGLSQCKSATNVIDLYEQNVFILKYILYV